MELNKNKYIKTEEDLNPNRKFIRNQAIELLEQNEERLSFSANHQKLIWDIHDDLLIKVFNKIKASKLFQDYMKGDEFSFEEDQKFIGKVFLRYVAENEDFQNHLEDLELAYCYAALGDKKKAEKHMKLSIDSLGSRAENEEHLKEQFDEIKEMISVLSKPS